MGLEATPVDLCPFVHHSGRDPLVLHHPVAYLHHPVAYLHQDGYEGEAGVVPLGGLGRQGRRAGPECKPRDISLSERKRRRRKRTGRD